MLRFLLIGLVSTARGFEAPELTTDTSLTTTIGSSGRTTTEEDYWAQWIGFKKEFAKEYTTLNEHNDRFEIFKANIDKINTHNAKGLSWTMGVNQFADLTPEEFKAETACDIPIRSMGSEEEIKLLDESKTLASVDWVAQGKVTAVKNQGQCGSCWAFSTTGAIESRSAIAQRSSPQSLSEQELVDCSGSYGNNGCNGGLMDYGFQYARANGGLCSERSYPYVARTETRECSSKRSSCGSKLDRISSYRDVSRNSESQLAAAVSQGPVSVAIEADQSAFQLYRGGVFSGNCGSRLDHGVLVVGYGSDGGQEFWKVKNSWGASWGEQGYIRICKNCNKNRSAGECGIASQPSYPVV